MNILVSGCLVGLSCRYDGKVKEYPNILELSKKHTLIPVCPEQLGGRSTPRQAVEIKDGKVLDINGNDHTQEFVKGANEVLKIAKLSDCNLAILKSKSPSCGYGEIYDGTFSKSLISGNGITAQFLSENGMRIKNEKEI
ncbi:MAG: DUF523 domain-containing protein [Anaerotignaceae bacterium]